MAVKKVTVTTKATSVVSSPEATGRRISATPSRVSKKPATAAKKSVKLSADVLDIKGKVIESVELPAEIFGAKINAPLMTQAVRVYLANQRAGSASTKTRSEVIGSTRKIYKQKGTGRARHGAAKAPIFVHGGVAHGPKPTDFSLSFTKKMKKKALFSALSSKMQGGQIKVISGLEKVTPKTKERASIMKVILGEEKKRKVLLVLEDDGENKNQNIIRAGRNLKDVTYTAADRLNAYEVINSKMIFMVKDAIGRMESHFLRKEKV